MGFRDNITFGDVDIDPIEYQDIMYDNRGVSVVALPAVLRENGIKKVNFNVIDEYRKACDDFEKQTGLKNYNQIKTKEQLEKWLNVLKLHNLYQYANVDENGNFDSSPFGVFIVVDGYFADKDKKIKNSDYVEKITDRQQLKKFEEKMIRGLSVNSESDQNNKGKYTYRLDTKDKPGIVEWIGGSTPVYKGTIFIPIHNDLNAAYYDTYQLDMSQVSAIESLKQ